MAFFFNNGIFLDCITFSYLDNAFGIFNHLLDCKLCLLLYFNGLTHIRTKEGCITLPIILCKHAYHTYVTKYIMRYKLVPHYTFGSKCTICMFAKDYVKHPPLSEPYRTFPTPMDKNKCILFNDCFQYFPILNPTSLKQIIEINGYFCKDMTKIH